MSAVRYELVQDIPSFRSIAAPWDALKTSVFHCHSWLDAWLTNTTTHTPLIALAWHDRDLVSVLPFAVRQFRGVRILEWMAQDFSDYCDGFGDPIHFAEMWATVHKAGGFDLVRLKNLTPQAASLRNLRPYWSDRLWEFDDVHDCCLRLSLAPMWTNGDEWFRTLNKKKRNNHSRGWRILNEIAGGNVTFRQCDRSEVVRVVRILRGFKRDWLRATQQNSPLLDSSDEMFDALIEAMAVAGVLRIFVIARGGEVIAGSINLDQGTEMLAFFAAYDARYSRASPGILLMTDYTRWAFNNGFQRIDYLRGDESYKFEFANENVWLGTVEGPKTLLGCGALLSYRLLRFGKQKVSRGPQKGTNPAPVVGAAYETKSGTLRMPKARDNVG